LLPLHPKILFPSTATTASTFSKARLYIDRPMFHYAFDLLHNGSIIIANIVVPAIYKVKKQIESNDPEFTF